MGEFLSTKWMFFHFWTLFGWSSRLKCKLWGQDSNYRPALVCLWPVPAINYGRWWVVSTAPGNPGNLLEFVWSSWKLLCKMSMIDYIGFQSLLNWVPGRLFMILVALFIFATALLLCISCFCSISRQTSRFGTWHSRPKQCKHVLDFSWNPSWNLLEISWKFVQLNL